MAVVQALPLARFRRKLLARALLVLTVASAVAVVLPFFRDPRSIVFLSDEVLDRVLFLMEFEKADRDGENFVRQLAKVTAGKKPTEMPKAP
jgi:hypothetical protein